MSRSTATAEVPGTFRRFDDFVEFARSHYDHKARFTWTAHDGAKEVMFPGEAFTALEQLRKFIGAPELLTNHTLNDGRMEVALHNYQSITQHMRWACGLDFDSRPKSRETTAAKWTEAALLWFWHNGGDPPPGLSGDYADWAKDVQRDTDIVRNVGRYVKAMPEVLEEVPF